MKNDKTSINRIQNRTKSKARRDFTLLFNSINLSPKTDPINF